MGRLPTSTSNRNSQEYAYGIAWMAISTRVSFFRLRHTARLSHASKSLRPSASIDNRQIDFRVSTFPSYYGEKVVIRILDRDQGFIPLDQIGLTPRNLELVRKAVTAPHGLVLISGPTGSGKSTTLYSMLTEVDREHKNVLSLEDPVE